MKNYHILSIYLLVVFFLLSCNFSPEKAPNSSLDVKEVNLPMASNSMDDAFPPSLPGTMATNRSLHKYWNLVSFPVDQTTDVVSFLKSDEKFVNIQSVWQWDTNLGEFGDWRVYPQISDFALLTKVTPNGGYWLNIRSAFDFTGTGLSENVYSFNQGWNLIGYSHSASSIAVSNFFTQGDFWKDACGFSAPVVSVWGWQGTTWRVYFPDDADRVTFNNTMGISYEALETLEPGMGVWVNAARNNAPAPTNGCESFEVIELGTSSTVTLPQNTISFLLHVFGEANSGFTIGFKDLTDSQENNVIPTKIGEEFLTYTPKYGNALVPLIPSASATGGQWNFVTYPGAIPNQSKITIRAGASPTSSTLAIQPYITGTQYTAGDIAEGLSIMASIFTNSGLGVDLKNTIVITDSQYATVNASFTHSNTEALVSMGLANVINLFIVEDFLGYSVLGMAPSIPGSLGITGRYNGVLVALESHLSGTSLNHQVLGGTMAHEIGHFLGLFHTTEHGGDYFDPLADTPQCDINRDATENGGNGDGIVLSNECIGYGADNLMFWTASPEVNNTFLSSDQIHILNYSPLAK